jgi:hypothetical protein
VSSPGLTSRLKQLLATDEPASLGPERRASAWSVKMIDQAFRRSIANEHLPPQHLQLLRCVALLWHDHLDAAHQIAQEIETPDGSWLHGIVHRREPDYWNAKYWLRRAGAHPAFSALTQQESLLSQRQASSPNA